MPRKLAAGNWKMNGLRTDVDALDAIGKQAAPFGTDYLICPPATLLITCQDLGLSIGAQDCHTATSGAHTGDLSAEMLADAGASAVIVGHSERRTDHGESNADVVAKALAAHRAGLTAIVCIGETLAEREAGQALPVIAEQLAGSVPDGSTAKNTVIAYEPVWAIGTGKVPTPAQIAEVHNALREQLARRFSDSDDFSLLYGGSVKAGNAAEIFAVANVDGALVGGASLKADDFIPILQALDAG